MSNTTEATIVAGTDHSPGAPVVITMHGGVYIAPSL